jgi:hypothetical protein
MVSGTDTTLDLHLLERIGLLVVLGSLLLHAAGLEANRGLEHDVLTECGGVSRACGLAGLVANLFPCAALSNARVLLTFLPSSLMKMVTTVSVPSLFFETWGAGMAVARSGSPSSAQSTVFCAFVAMFAVVICVSLR